MLSSVTVRAPATTANLGPGFDCLGMALDIWNVVHVRLGPASFEVRGEGKGELETGPENLVYESFRMAFAEAGQPAPEVRIVCDNGVPVARGLGSSSAAVVAGLTAGNELMGRAIGDDRLLQMASDLEGHSDNVAAALLGGCRVVVQDGGRLVTGAVAVPDGLKAVLFIPDMPMATEQARALLPGSVSAEDAVYNIGRVGLLVGALSSGDLSLLRYRNSGQAAPAVPGQDIPRDEEHFPERHGRRRPRRLPVGGRLHRSGADTGPGGHHRLRNGGRGD